MQFIDLLEWGYKIEIYRNKSLNAYTNNDPISIKQTELHRIDIEKKQLLLELKILREG